VPERDEAFADEGIVADGRWLPGRHLQESRSLGSVTASSLLQDFSINIRTRSAGG
jgi:hypothetical protein